MSKTIFYRLRKEKGLSIEQLSGFSGVAIGTISMLENGQTTDPRCSTMRALARVLGPAVMILEGGD